MAITRAAYSEPGARLPLPVYEAALWERFGWLPSQLDAEDAARVMQGVYGLDLYRAMKKQQSGGSLTDNENRMVGHALKADLEAN